MQTQASEIIETEVFLEEAMSFNHSRLIGRLSVLLAPYEGQYDVLPELEFELSTGRLKPDVAILPRQPYDWEQDIIRYPHPPTTAIEILSPTQSLDFLITKIRQLYLPAGVQSAWLVAPAVKSVYLFLPDQPTRVLFAGTLQDPASGIELAIATLFR